MLFFPPAGETRAAYLYARPGQAGNLQEYVSGHLADHFVLVETEQALAAGLFGTGEPSLEFRDRVGSFLLLARDGSRLVLDEEEKKFEMLGHHGSLLAEEMLVPLLMVRLDG
jgi:hypothetical protein